MIEFEINDQKVTVPSGTTVMEAAKQLGIEIPHFCYHDKLSIAANCRMCLVEIEKAPKPMPACATPAAANMKVYTQSAKACAAQQGVMEFLLINHPLDCPICDQGGECQLQDLALGYGNSASQYNDAKRIVFAKDFGPLVSGAEMTRCIQCTRCVRFGQEIAGEMELGMNHRGEHAEIASFVGRSVTSELSGNMIDLCPVGALTSKPYRYSGRAWEMTRKNTISPHDALGSAIEVHSLRNEIKRVLPIRDDTLNECWLADKDRFSYDALHRQRLSQPLIKDNDALVACAWDSAFDQAANAMNTAVDQHGGDAVALIASGHATLEELQLIGQISQHVANGQFDYRTRQQDFRPEAATLRPWLGMTVAEVDTLAHLFFIGGPIHLQAPVLTGRLRRLVAKGLNVHSLSAWGVSEKMPLATALLAKPSLWPVVLAYVYRQLSDQVSDAIGTQADALPTALRSAADNLVTALQQAQPTAIWLCPQVLQTRQLAEVNALARGIADVSGATFGILGAAVNDLGAALLHERLASTTRQDLLQAATPSKAVYMFYGLDPLLDCYDPLAVKQHMTQADVVIWCAPFMPDAELAPLIDIVLPIAAFTENEGSYINCEGRVRRFNAVAHNADYKPGWKVLQKLAHHLKLSALNYVTVDQISAAAFATIAVDDDSARLLPELLHADTSDDTEQLLKQMATANHVAGQFERVGDVPIYNADTVVRRAEVLAQTPLASAPVAHINDQDAADYGIESGQMVKLTNDRQHSLNVNAVVDTTVARGALKLAAARPETIMLGNAWCQVTISLLEGSQ